MRDVLHGREGMELTSLDVIRDDPLFELPSSDKGEQARQSAKHPSDAVARYILMTRNVWAPSGG
jgi:hypothetical protein